MAPNVVSSPIMTGVLFEDDNIAEIKPKDTARDPKKEAYHVSIVWTNVVIFVYLHLAALYGAHLMFTSASIWTSVFAYIMYQIGGLGITAGVHRLWSHRAYKATLPLRIFLMLCNTVAYQDSVIKWARDHRVHHKYSETDADPHNRKRGFFFSHIGWLLVRKRPEVAECGERIDISDLRNDSVLDFQHKYYFYLMPMICFILPTLVPVYAWGETWSNSWHVATVLRYVWTLNMTWLVNSAAHTWGNQPYDKGIFPRQNLFVAIGAMGEGWHNFHHVFPWDYKTSELGNYRVNVTNAFLDLMAIIGWAYDFKTVSPSMIKARVERTGDGTHEIWGWGDKDMSDHDKEITLTINKKTH